MNEILNDICNMDQGCILGINRVNILAYADDIVLCASSIKNMNDIFTKFCCHISDVSLKINFNKTKCMMLGSNRQRESHTVLNNTKLEVVTSYDYLGHIIKCDLRDDLDLQKRLNNFYSSFNGILRQFAGVDVATFLFLFNSYCKPVYGLPLLNHKGTLQSCLFKAFEIAYSKSMKRMLGVPPPVYSSNHQVAQQCNQMLLRHHLALTQCRYLNRLLRTNNAIIKTNMPFFKEGLFFKNVLHSFKDNYNVDILDNDEDIIYSRIMWVQTHEERRHCTFTINR